MHDPWFSRYEPGSFVHLRRTDTTLIPDEDIKNYLQYYRQNYCTISKEQEAQMEVGNQEEGLNETSCDTQRLLTLFFLSLVFFHFVSIGVKNGNLMKIDIR